MSSLILSKKVTKVNLLRQLVERKLMKFDEDFMNKKELFWDFYQSFGMVNAILDKKPNLHGVTDIWRKSKQGDVDSTVLLRSMVYKQRETIYNYLKEIKELEDKEQAVGDMYRSGSIAVLSYDYK